MRKTKSLTSSNQRHNSEKLKKAIAVTLQLKQMTEAPTQVPFRSQKGVVKIFSRLAKKLSTV